MALSCIICEMKRDIGRKSWFSHTTLHSTLRLGGSPSEYCHPVWCAKTRLVGLRLPDGEKNFEDICNRLDSIPTDRQTDRRTDRRTDGRTDRQTDILPRHSPRYAYASRGKNGPLRLIWHSFASSQNLLIIFGSDRPYSILNPSGS